MVEKDVKDAVAQVLKERKPKNYVKIFRKSIGIDPVRHEKVLKKVQGGNALSLYDFKSPELIETAYDTLLALAGGHTHGEIDKVSAATSLSAIKLIFDKIIPSQITQVVQTLDDDIDPSDIEVDLGEF